MTLNAQIRRILDIHVDQLTCKRDGTFVARRGYYYTHGMDETKFSNGLRNALLPTFVMTVITKGNHFTGFLGGSPIKSQSHWYVHFSVKES